MRGSTAVVKFLIANKVNINCRDKGENTPLHIAALYEYLEITKLLLKNYAEINVRTLNGTTPLHHACEKANFAITQLLLKKVCLSLLGYVCVFYSISFKRKSMSILRMNLGLRVSICVCKFIVRNF